MPQHGDTKTQHIVLDEVAAVLTAVSSDQMSAAARQFSDRGRRWFFTGQGRSGLVAQMAAMRLMHVGFDAHAVGEATAPSIGADDGIVIISGSGETPVTVHLARLADALRRAHPRRHDAPATAPLAGLAEAVLEVPTTRTGAVRRLTVRAERAAPARRDSPRPPPETLTLTSRCRPGTPICSSGRQASGSRIAPARSGPRRPRAARAPTPSAARPALRPPVLGGRPRPRPSAPARRPRAGPRPPAPRRGGLQLAFTLRGASPGLDTALPRAIRGAAA